ncbi:M48 family metalloprotease [Oleisolibacter albus]|uniref:M48 family metalloprotease n=1 Tax=Oleisolibacter albus TaxID=2171757 RepID=UPI0013901D5E|nr:M48 family metalloprotease [Oleisolibacter albus]
METTTIKSKYVPDDVQEIVSRLSSALGINVPSVSISNSNVFSGQYDPFNHEVTINKAALEDKCNLEVLIAHELAHAKDRCFTMSYMTIWFISYVLTILILNFVLIKKNFEYCNVALLFTSFVLYIILAIFGYYWREIRADARAARILGVKRVLFCAQTTLSPSIEKSIRVALLKRSATRGVY